MKTILMGELSKHPGAVMDDLPVKVKRRNEVVAVIMDIDQYIDLTGAPPTNYVPSRQQKEEGAIRQLIAAQQTEGAMLTAADELGGLDSDADDVDTIGGGREEGIPQSGTIPTPPQGAGGENSNTSGSASENSNPILPLSDPVLRKQEEILRELREAAHFRLVSQPHRTFIPTGIFSDFVNKSMGGRYRDNLFEAANGVGKTFGMANMLANLFWPVGNPYFQQSLFKKWPYPKQGRIISQPNTIVETIIPTLKAVFPKARWNVNKYETTKEGKRYEEHWTTDTGWDFRLMTYDQDVTEFESANLGWFWEDEPSTREIHTANYARLRMGGVGFVTETPLKGSQWLYDEFVDKMESKLEEENKSVTVADVESACVEHGIRGFIPHKQILEQIQGYNEDERQARVFGKHHHLSGLIFKKWNPLVHVIKPFTITKAHFVVVQSFDPHPRTPDAVLWVAIDREGNHFVINELFVEMETTELAERIKDIERNYRVVKRMIDPSAFNVDKHTGYQLANDLSRNFYLDYEPGSKERTNAVEKIREFLDYQEVPGSEQILLPPKLFVFDNCEKTRWEIQRYQWQDWRGTSAQFKNPKEKPVDKDDHLIECLGRVLLSDTRFEEEGRPDYVPSEVRDKMHQKQIQLDPYR